jgi:hypothetical protein
MGRTRAVCLLATVAAVASSAVLVGGCGSSSVSNAIDPVAKAATVSNQAPGMRMKFVLRLTTPVLPAPIVGNGSGTFNSAAHSGSVTFTMDLGGIPAVTQLLGSSKLQIQEILSGLTLYLKLPAALGHNPALHGKPWLKINLARAARAAGIPGVSSLLNNPSSTDPSQFLRYLEATSGGVTKVGSQSVDGFQTTEYRARINLDRVANAAPAADRAQVRQTIAALERVAHIHSMPVKVWIDARHLVRREELSFAETVSGQSVNAAIRIDIPQYGPEPQPQLPPASQVADLTHLAAGA